MSKLEKLKKQVNHYKLDYIKVYENGLVKTSDGYYGHINKKDYTFSFYTMGLDKLTLKEFACTFVSWIS